MVGKDFSDKEILAIRIIRNSLAHFGYFPSIRELTKSLNYKSLRSAQDVLETLQIKGVVKKQMHGRYQLLTDPDLGISHAKTLDVPIVGFVSCGAPIFAEQNIEGYIPISTSLAKPGNKYFLLHASGDSMNLAGINDGDLVLIRQQSTAHEGERAVALIDDEATIKEFHKTQDLVILKPRSSNPKHKPIVLENEFQLQGVVVAVIPSIKYG